MRHPLQLLLLLCSVWLAESQSTLGTGFLISLKCVAISPTSGGGVKLVQPVPKSAPASALVVVSDSLCADNQPCKTVKKCTPKDRRLQRCSLVCECESE
jgi:hypothetical protein